LGGPDCLSRAEFAKEIYHFFNVSTSNVKALPRSECKEKWAHVSPQPKNLKMNLKRLQRIVGFEFKSISETLDLQQLALEKKLLMLESAI